MSNETIMRQKDIRPPPCEIEYKGMRFLITDRPNDQIIHNYIAVSNTNILNLNFSHIINELNYIFIFVILGTKEA